jgi:hypothetical protein
MGTSVRMAGGSLAERHDAHQRPGLDEEEMRRDMEGRSYALAVSSLYDSSLIAQFP